MLKYASLSLAIMIFALALILLGKFLSGMVIVLAKIILFISALSFLFFIIFDLIRRPKKRAR